MDWLARVHDPNKVVLAFADPGDGVPIFGGWADRGQSWVADSELVFGIAVLADAAETVENGVYSAGLAESVDHIVSVRTDALLVYEIGIGRAGDVSSAPSILEEIALVAFTGLGCWVIIAIFWAS